MSLCFQVFCYKYKPTTIQCYFLVTKLETKKCLGKIYISFLKTIYNSFYKNSPKRDYIEYLANTSLNAATSGKGSKFQEEKFARRVGYTLRQTCTRTQSYIKGYFCT